ncbi:MAG: hypothetical protein SVK08_13455 [Halobacteriota archaeon]|nr:hypothetical protein [Halobacteriota archaeon]
MKTNRVMAYLAKAESKEEQKNEEISVQLSAMDDMTKAVVDLEDAEKGMYDFYGNVKRAEKAIITLMKQAQGIEKALENNYDTFRSARTLIEEAARELGIEVSDLPPKFKEAIITGDRIDGSITTFKKAKAHMLTAYQAIGEIRV